MIGITELILLILIFLFPPFVIALIDVLRSKFSGNDKIVWALVVTLLPLIGPILYLIIGTKQKKRPER